MKIKTFTNQNIEYEIKGIDYNGKINEVKTHTSDDIIIVEGDSAGTRYGMMFIPFPSKASLPFGFGVIHDPCFLVMNDLTRRSYLFRVHGYLSIDYYYEKIFGRNAWQSLDNPDVVFTHILTLKIQEMLQRRYPPK